MRYNKNKSFKTYDCLVKNITDLMCGELDKHFNPEELDKAKHIAFLLDNFTIDIDSNMCIFEYEDINMRIGGIVDAEELEFENYMISLFLRQDDYLRAYKMFERDFKLGKIIDN